ncbi:cag pathogenicity island Cag12 family protein [Sodalis glossinidius]|uniref:cag pathogenicity island Cag12 family protein n=1 Tax=Sodalis glossinidius TaxID=63612 RepID=UPI0011D037EC|nr:cag pathogenicity island Cag12 family protein [Sodalis glossinidius]
MKFIVLTVGGIFLADCSSPLPVNWSGIAIEINSTMLDWKENNVVIPSPVITGQKRFVILMEKKGAIFPMITLLSLMPIRLWY